MSDPRPRRNALVAVGAATQLGFLVGTGALLGYTLDRWLDTSPWALLGLVLLAFFTGLAFLIRAALWIQDDDDEPRNHHT